MTVISAGLLLFRRRGEDLDVLLAHPGGPYYDKRDEGFWTIPKGEVERGDDLLETAIREFREETGVEGQGRFLPLGSVRQQGGKVVHAWAFEGAYDDSRPPQSNTFEMEWPPRSGRRQAFPEIDRAVFFALDAARRKINPAQAPFLDRLAAALR